MDSRPFLDEAPPVLVQPGETSAAAAHVTPAPVPPTLPPIPSLDDEVEVPSYAPFAYANVERLSPEGLAVITLFHETWLQPPDLTAQVQACSSGEAKRVVFRRAQADCARTLPYLRQQYRDACVGPDGPQSQEALQVKRNLDWAEQVAARDV